MITGVVGSRAFGNYTYYLDFVNKNKKNKSKVNCEKLALSYVNRDYDFMRYSLDLYSITEIVSGGAQGADALAERYANDKDLLLTVINANWDKYGKSAGYKRNLEIVERSEIIIAFWDGVSKGTKHTIDIASNENKEVIVYYF